MNSKKEASIGIFDSGFGGLTVMKALKEVLPNEHMIYFGDTARVPYGNKSPETILKYTIENASFLIEKGIKLLVIACHTACSVALPCMGNMFNVPIIGIQASGIEEVAKTSKSGRIGILGTRATIGSGVYQTQITRLLPKAEIIALPCPLFVPLVEEGYIDHVLTEMVVKEYLLPLSASDVDTLLLGCTHYPLLKDSIKKEIGPLVNVVDPAIKCAQHVRLALETAGLLNTNKDTPEYHFYVTDDADKFRSLGRIFLNYPIENIILKD
ncbi:MAG: glutamate racemase [Rhabdochlamydiaceae bacterium]